MKKLVITTMAIATMSLSTLASMPWKLSNDIRDRAAIEWPDDYTMQEYETKQQVAAWIQINGK